MSEISNLKAQISALQDRLSALEPKPAAPPAAKYEEPGVKISTFVERGQFEMPTAGQARQLLSLVLARYPALRLVGDNITERDREVELDRFLAAFFYLGHVDRRAGGQLDVRGYPSWYCDVARDWLRSFGGRLGEDVSPKTYIAAALAHADIAIASQDDFRSGYGFGIAIVPIGSGGRKCNNAWKVGRVCLMAPVCASRSGFRPSATSRVQCELRELVPCRPDFTKGAAIGPQDASSPSKAFASCRSSVSKPSVNQP
jgi:hypothetical protein